MAPDSLSATLTGPRPVCQDSPWTQEASRLLECLDRGSYAFCQPEIEAIVARLDDIADGMETCPVPLNCYKAARQLASRLKKEDAFKQDIGEQIEQFLQALTERELILTDRR